MKLAKFLAAAKVWSLAKSMANAKEFQVREFQVLHALSSGAKTNQRLCELTGIQDRKALTPVLRRLRERGYITVSCPPLGDQRYKSAKISDAGAARYRKISSAISALPG